MSVANKLEKLMPIVKRRLRYLAGTRDRGLIYPISNGTSLTVSAQVDSDFSGDTTKKSTYCRYTYLDNCLINFCTKLQKSVATSTCNAEFNGITEAVTDILYYRVCIENLKGRTWPLSLSPFAVNYPPCDCKRAEAIKNQLDSWTPAPPSVLFSDSQTAIACVKNNKTTPGTKNETNKSAFVHEVCNSGLVSLQHCEGTKLCPDAGTKALAPEQFEALIISAQPTEESLKPTVIKGTALVLMLSTFSSDQEIDPLDDCHFLSTGEDNLSQEFDNMDVGHTGAQESFTASTTQYYHQENFQSVETSSSSSSSSYSKPSSDDSSINDHSYYNKSALHSLAHAILADESVAPTNNFPSFPYEMKAPDYQRLASSVNNGVLMFHAQQLLDTPLVNAPIAQPTRRKRGRNKKKLQQKEKRFNRERGSHHPLSQIQIALRSKRNNGLAHALDVEAITDPNPTELQEAICFYTHLPMLVPPGLPDISQTAGIDPSVEKTKFSMLWQAPDKDNGVIIARDVKIGIKVHTHRTQYFKSDIPSCIGDNLPVCLINIVHGVYGLPYKHCIIRVNTVRLSSSEKYDQSLRIKHDDVIEIEYYKGLIGGADSPPAVKERKDSTTLSADASTSASQTSHF